MLRKRVQTCKCATQFQVKLARQDEYHIFKKLLDIGHHPAFIGRSTYERYAGNGGALFYEYERQAVAVSLINPRLGVLIALNVHPTHRKHGLGAAAVAFLMPHFVRAIESKIEWFTTLGYKSVGAAHSGISLRTQLMVRSRLFDLAGNVRRIFAT